MNPEYSKLEFTSDEKELMKKQSEIVRFKYSDKIPILIRIKSNVLTTEKYKFLIPTDLSLSETIIGITTRIVNKDNKPLVFNITDLKGNNSIITNEIKQMSLEDIYNKYKDPEIDVLVLGVSRNTLYKWSKSFLF